tara:strand:- start:1543 stop:1731 length:189 start_codon:yes stop_codon:yes gene_type:complete
VFALFTDIWSASVLFGVFKFVNVGASGVQLGAECVLPIIDVKIGPGDKPMNRRPERLYAKCE